MPLDVFSADQFAVQVLDELETITPLMLQQSQGLACDILFIAQKTPHQLQPLMTVNRERVLKNFNYEMVGSPFEHMPNETTCVYIEDVRHLYPEDLTLQKMEVESCFASPIMNEQEQTIGLLVGLFCSPNSALHEYKLAFETFARFLGASLNNMHSKKRAHAQLSLHREVEEISQTGAWEYDVATKKIFWSREVYQIYGLCPTMPVSADVGKSYYTKEARQQISSLFQKAIDSGQSYRGDFELVDAKGQYKWVRTSGKAEQDVHGKTKRIFGAIEDITSEKQLFLSNIEHTNLLECILNNLNDAVITINRYGKIKHVNNAALDMFGYEFSEMVNSRIESLMPQPYSSQHQRYMKHYHETGEAKIIGIGRQLPAIRKSGEIFQMELSLTTSDFDGETQYVGVIRDISERIKAQDTIYSLAYSDSITGLKNSKWFEKECKDLLIRALLKRHCIFCLIIDVDKMAQFNLQFGFEKGDKALRSIANKLESIIGNEFNIYKHEADSFIVLGKSTRKKAETYLFKTQMVESALLNKMNYDVSEADEKIVLSASVGSAIFEANKHSVETILSTLEYALKQAKQYSPFGSHYIGELGLNEYERTNKIRTLLKAVTTSGELSLVMQPQYANIEKFVSFEALIRWESSELGFISPADFIPIAEESEAIIAIGDWVLSSVCQILHAAINDGIYMRISVNISAKQIVSSDFTDKLLKTTKQWNIPANCLVLELTETTLVADLELVKKTMCKLSELGFGFSIDDFGTGYSSLAYLKELPIVELKIDKYFVDDIKDSHGEKFAIVDAIIDMAKALGVKSVAEGVENKDQYLYLSKRGCDIYQGYFFSKPLDIQSCRDLYQPTLSEIDT
jgi:PAS domain S-box-containing protein/diguanylate cyclase (GGDEF)-like protein